MHNPSLLIEYISYRDYWIQSQTVEETPTELSEHPVYGRERRGVPIIERDVSGRNIYLKRLSTSLLEGACKSSNDWLRISNDVAAIWGRGSAGRSGRGLLER